MVNIFKQYMFSNLRQVAFAAILIGYAQPASAQTTLADNWYIGGFGGVAILGNEPFKSLYFSPFGATPSNIVSLEHSSNFDSGYAFGGVVGSELDKYWRGELEIFFQRNKFDANHTFLHVDEPAIHTGKFEGAISSASILANIWHDFEGVGAITPYLGGGIGVSLVTLQIEGSDINNGVNVADFVLSTNQTDIGLAFQLGTGVRAVIAENTYLDIGYRFRGVTGLDLNFNRLGASKNNDSINLLSHTFQIGLTYKFK